MKNHKIHFLMFLPLFCGVIIFYLIPFLYSFYYSVIDNMADKNIIGFSNYSSLLKNELFLSASAHTILFMVISIPLSIIISLIIAVCLKKVKRFKGVFAVSLLMPMMVPSGAIVYFWKILFDNNGLINKLLFCFGFKTGNLANTSFAFVIILIIFIWKNISYNIALFWSGLNFIPNIYYEQYRLEGATPIKEFTGITLVYLSPTTFIVLIISIINSFRVFREIYSLYGAYPSMKIYMIQHFMNNLYQNMNIQKLSAAAYILFMLIGGILLLLFFAQKKISDSIN